MHIRSMRTTSGVVLVTQCVDNVVSTRKRCIGLDESDERRRAETPTCLLVFLGSATDDWLLVASRTC